MIPDKNLFLVTSSLKPVIGAFTDEQRFSQTIATLKSLRKVVPNAIIVFTDVSIRSVSALEKESIAGLCDAYIDLSHHPDVRRLSEEGQKSSAENVLIFVALHTLKQNNLLKDVKRIFKISARSELENTFDISEYDNLFGKYVFKTRIPTWRQSGEPSHLLITRLFSMCSSLVEDYLGVLIKNSPLLHEMDFEHAHFVNISKQYLIEFDKIHCWGWISGTGQIEHY